jgi:hypothetical protein
MRPAPHPWLLAITSSNDPTERQACPLQDCASWPHLEGRNASAVQHHESVAMPGAEQASVSSKRFDDSFDYLVLILVMFMTDV